MGEGKFRKNIEQYVWRMRGNKFWLRVKEILWYWGFTNKMICPNCGERLTEFGYSDFGHYYRCDKCHWGDEE